MKTEYRFIIYIAGKDVPGDWLAIDEDTIVKDCAVYVANRFAFSVEFR